MKLFLKTQLEVKYYSNQYFLTTYKPYYEFPRLKIFKDKLKEN